MFLLPGQANLTLLARAGRARFAVDLAARHYSPRPQADRPCRCRRSGARVALALDGRWRARRRRSRFRRLFAAAQELRVADRFVHGSASTAARAESAELRPPCAPSNPCAEPAAVARSLTHRTKSNTFYSSLASAHRKEEKSSPRSRPRGTRRSTRGSSESLMYLFSV